MDELAVSVVCINNMDPMPELPEILNLATDPGSSGVIKHLPPPHPIKFRRSGVSVFKCQHALVIRTRVTIV